MKIRFTKDIEVPFYECRFAEDTEKVFRRGQTVEVVAVEKLDRQFVNLHFENGDLAIEVPVSSYQPVS